jgi:hypothetical protein
MAGASVGSRSAINLYDFQLLKEPRLVAGLFHLRKAQSLNLSETLQKIYRFYLNAFEEAPF